MEPKFSFDDELALLAALWSYPLVQYAFWIIVVFSALLALLHLREKVHKEAAKRIYADLDKLNELGEKVRGACVERRFIKMKRLSDQLIAAGATPAVMTVLSEHRVLATNNAGEPDDQAMQALCWAKVSDSLQYKADHSSRITDPYFVTGWRRESPRIRLDSHHIAEIIDRSARMEIVSLASEHGIRSLAEIDKIDRS